MPRAKRKASPPPKKEQETLETPNSTAVVRCPWIETDSEFLDYHDNIWGTPCHDDTTLFEYLTLSGAQAGLSYKTIYRRREGYRKAFANYDIGKLAAFTASDIEKVLQDTGIIRNKAKVNSVVANAKVVLAIQKEFGSFSKYLWSFVNHAPITHNRPHEELSPTTSTEAEALSVDLKKRGAKFVGPTILYAYMQSMGLYNDHKTSCFKGFKGEAAREKNSSSGKKLKKEEK